MNQIFKSILVVLLILNISVVFAVKRIIVQCKPTTTTSKINASKATGLELNKPLSVNMLQQISALAGTQATEIGRVGVGGHIILLNKVISQDKFKVLVKTLEAKPNIKYVEEDKTVKSMANVSMSRHK